VVNFEVAGSRSRRDNNITIRLGPDPESSPMTPLNVARYQGHRRQRTKGAVQVMFELARETDGGRTYRAD